MDTIGSVYQFRVDMDYGYRSHKKNRFAVTLTKFTSIEHWVVKLLYILTIIGF